MKKHLDKIARQRDQGPGDQPSFRLPDPQPQQGGIGMSEEGSELGGEGLGEGLDEGLDTPFLDLLGYDPTDMGGFTYLEELSSEEREQHTEVRRGQDKERNKKDKKSTKEALDIATTDLSGDTMRGHTSLMEELLLRVRKAPSIDEGIDDFTLSHKTKQVNPLHDTARRKLRESQETEEKYGEKVEKTKGKAKKKNRQKRDTAFDEVERLEDIGGRIQLEGPQIEALAAAGWGEDPTKLSLVGRLKNGPGLSGLEMEAITALSSGGAGMKWLSFAGLYSIGRASSYLQAGKFYDWLKLEAETRVELATIAYDWGVGKDEKTPAYTLGRHFVLRSSLDEDERLEAEEGRDTDIRNTFVDTMLNTESTPDVERTIESGAIGAKQHGKVGAIMGHISKNDRKRTDSERIVDENAQAIGILEKVFILLQAGLQVYDDESGEHVDLPEGTDVCRALAHGGRVNVRIPQIGEGQTGRELTDWLGLTKPGDKLEGAGGAVVSRGFGTHHMDIGKNTEEGLGDFIEDGEIGATIRNIKEGVRIWGVNVSAGGLGNRDHNGDVILPDGSHGHMFVSFQPPETDRDGALMIGLETTGPGGASLVGYSHGVKSSEATANPESSFGGHKTDKIGDGSPRGVTRDGLVTHSEEIESWEETNGRFVDLREINGGDWLSYLKDLDTTFEEMKEQDPRGALEKLVGPQGGLLQDG